MAEHPDRYVCGKCGKTFFRLTADGKRLPIPKQNKKVEAVVAAVVGKGKAPAKKRSEQLLLDFLAGVWVCII